MRSVRTSLSALLSALALLATPLLGGCPNPQGEFDEFVQRQSLLDLSVNMPDQGPSKIFDVTGHFLLAVSTTLDPTHPLQFVSDVTLVQTGNTATIAMQAQALRVDNRMPTGNLITVAAQPVASDGTFSLPFGTQMVSGDANPITGSDIVADLTLKGVTRSANRLCGDITGMVLMPIALDLAGSTWGAIRIAPGTTGAALPAPDATCPAQEPMVDMATTD